jgi:aminocarboxymuconate-semialdehyde decarboxylase
MKHFTFTRREFFRTAGLAGAGSLIAPAVLRQSEAVSRSIRIDCQSHLLIPDVVDFMKKRKADPSVYEKDGFLWIKMGDWHRRILPNHMDIQAKIAAMDANDINITALSINDPGPEWFGEDGPEVANLMNNFIAGVTKKYPERFTGLCVLPLQDSDASEKELNRCITELGLRGILLYTNLTGSWPDEPQFRWLYSKAVEFDVPVLLHPAKPTTTEQVKGYNLTSLMGNMFENTIALARIIASGLLDEHSGLKLICPHLGGTLPYIAGRFDHQVTVLKRSNQNLKLKPSEYLRKIYFDIVSPLPQAIKFAVEFMGVDRLLFGSDHPWVDPKLIIECLKSLNLPREDEEKILGENARKLFKFV